MRCTTTPAERANLCNRRIVEYSRCSRDLWPAQLARALRTQAPAISHLEAADYDCHSLRILRQIAEDFDQELIVTFKPQRRMTILRGLTNLLYD